MDTPDILVLQASYTNPVHAEAIALAYRQATAALWLGAGVIWLAVGYLFNVVAGLGATVAPSSSVYKRCLIERTMVA